MNDLYKIRYGNIEIYLRKSVVADYWVFEGLLFADEYYSLKIKPDDIILDVGANIGIFTLKVAKKVKQVISIEPEPQNYYILQKNVKANKFSNVILLNYAVSDKEETVYFKNTGGTASVSKTGKPVVAKSLDNILNELGNPKVTILKMDIEGYEGKVLSNFKSHKEIRQVVIETHSKDLTTEITSILSSWGLTVIDISKINRLRVLKNIISHPFSFLLVEKHNHYSTLKQTIKYLLNHSKSPVIADNPDSNQRLLYGFKK
jgi:FkbM family methyltransferase